MKKDKLILLMLQIGISFTFVYAAISSFINPQSWIGFIPNFITNTITRSYILAFFSFYEILLSIWLLSSKKLFYSSLLSSITLFFITILNFDSLDIVFRDIGLLFASISLVILSTKAYKENN